MNVKENSFDGAPGGFGGSINVQPSLGTHSSPDVSQNPAKFANGYYNPDVTGQPDTRMMDNSGSFDGEVEKLFAKKDKPTPDDMFAGLDYELSHMVKKDKSIAKQRVIDNMKKHGPKYYSGLNMLNIDEPSLTSNISENNQSAAMKERIRVLDDMVKIKSDRRQKMDPSIADILNVKREAKLNKFVELLKKPI